MTSYSKQLFQLLDTYAKSHYQYFLAEMFLNRTGTEFILCFRPTESNRNSPDRYACRYLQLPIKEAGIAEQQNMLSSAAKALLDKELAAL